MSNMADMINVFTVDNHQIVIDGIKLFIMESHGLFYHLSSFNWSGLS
jgi:hypothetical protein